MHRVNPEVKASTRNIAGEISQGLGSLVLHCSWHRLTSPRGELGLAKVSLRF